MWDRKAYDREHSRKKYKEYIERRTSLVESGKLGSCCYFCEAKAKREFHFHHVQYDPIESNYPKNAKGWSRWRRLKEAEQHPERFKLLCCKCHGDFEGILRKLKSKYNLNKFIAFLQLHADKLEGN